MIVLARGKRGQAHHVDLAKPVAGGPVRCLRCGRRFVAMHAEAYSVAYHDQYELCRKTRRALEAA